MLKIHFYKERDFIRADELYDAIGLQYNKYDRWINTTIINAPQALPKQGRDFIYIEDRSRVKTRRKQLLYFSLSFTKEVCYATKTIGAKKVREWLIETMECNNINAKK